jgi:DNA repair protein RecO (recombination protein O)
MKRSFNATALVLKYKNTGERERVVTLVTAERGKIVSIAKGVRKLKSSKSAFLQPGNIVKVQLIETKSLPILTQATLESDLSVLHGNLAKLRQLSLVLEIFDRLLVEEELEEDLFELILETRDLVTQPNARAKIKRNLENLVMRLGFAVPEKNRSLLEMVGELSGKSMKSWDYLSA